VFMRSSRPRASVKFISNLRELRNLLKYSTGCFPSLPAVTSVFKNTISVYYQIGFKSHDTIPSKVFTISQFVFKHFCISPSRPDHPLLEQFKTVFKGV
jgi:hypothetical protein